MGFLFFLVVVFLATNNVSSVDGKNFTGISEKKCNSTSGCSFPWHYCDNGTCTCAPTPQWDLLQCGNGESPNITTGQCSSVDQYTLSTYIGHCPYYFDSTYVVTFPYISHELNDYMCGKHFNRTGILCGKCKDGHYPLAHSFDMNCVKCSNGKSNWWKYVLATFLPLTVFFFVVVLFRINITSSHLLGFVFCCQGLVMPPMARAVLVSTLNMTGQQKFVRYFGSLYSIWNLDFLRFFKLEICLGTDTLQTLALELVVGVYPLLLLMLCYLLIHLYDSNYRILVWIWKPFKAMFSVYKRNWEVKTSMIDAFATFFLLSSLKFLNVSFDLLAPVRVYQVNSTGHMTHSWRLYYNASMPYFGEAHFPYAVLMIAVLVVFVLLPALLLILYPFQWFQSFLNFFPIRWYVLHTFMDIFQGCYKDGTQPGSFDCRWFSAVYFFVRFLIIIIGVVLLNAILFPCVSIVLILTATLFIVFQPFKLAVPNYSDINAMFLLLLSLYYVSISGYQVAYVKKLPLMHLFLALSFLAAIVTVFYISFLIAKWIFKPGRIAISLAMKLRALRHGYETLL